MLAASNAASASASQRRAAIYLRVSTDQQRTDLQKDETTELIAKRGWELVATFEDNGVTGATSSRPGLAALREAAKSGTFDVLVVWRFDRLFRSLAGMALFVDELAKFDVTLVSCKEGYDTATPAGRLQLHMCAAVAQFEREIGGERTTAGMAAAQRRGKHVGRPFRIIDLRPVYRMLGEGMSMTAISRTMGISWCVLDRALRENAA